MIDKVYNVDSFNLDHTRVVAPYIRLAARIDGKHGDIIYKFDIRIKQPNKDHMDMKSLHSLEHLLAEYIRNKLEDVVDFSPMGCQTGFYLTVMNNSSIEDISKAIELTLYDVLESKEVPACNERQCGWAANHSLSGAQEIAREFLKNKNEWNKVFN